MLLTALLAGGAGWSWQRGFAASRERKLMMDGYRSVAVQTADYELLDVRPGDRVDVLVIFDASTRGAIVKHAATLLQNVTVLGTARSHKSDGKGVAYLMLNPLEAQYAALAPRQGEIDIVLRKPGDKEIHPMEMSDFRKLFR
jgi:Flp pilus assembly protein CpaB